MFSAIGKDIRRWCESLEARDAFDDITCNQIKDIFRTRWFGEGNKVGLFADQYLVATFLDPFTSPIPEKCLPNWVQSFKNVLKRFHKDDPGSLVDAEQEIYRLMADKEGTWARFVKINVRDQDLSVNLDTPVLGSFVNAVVLTEGKTRKWQADLVWQHHFQDEYPLLYQVARRVLVMSTQSADVE